MVWVFFVTTIIFALGLFLQKSNSDRKDILLSENALLLSKKSELIEQKQITIEAIRKSNIPIIEKAQKWDEYVDLQHRIYKLKSRVGELVRHISKLEQKIAGYGNELVVSQTSFL